MKLALFLLASLLLSAQVNAAPGPAAGSSEVITVVRTGNAYDITLPPDAAKKMTDRLWLVIDGKSEGFGGYDYDSEAGVFTMPLHYLANVSSDLDGQVKDILKAQGLPVKAQITTYRLAAGIETPEPNGSYLPSGITASQTLHFRHECDALVDTELPFSATYKVGDKITIFDVLALDSSITMHDVLGANDIESGKFAHLPNDLLHRITIQVQFVPNTMP